HPQPQALDGILGKFLGQEVGQSFDSQEALVHAVEEQMQHAVTACPRGETGILEHRVDQAHLCLVGVEILPEDMETGGSEPPLQAHPLVVQCRSLAEPRLTQQDEAGCTLYRLEGNEVWVGSSTVRLAGVKKEAVAANNEVAAPGTPEPRPSKGGSDHSDLRG